MNKKMKLLVSGLIAALMLAILPFAAFAQGESSPPRPERILLRALTDTAAQVLQMEPKALVQALREGKTPAQLAEDAGVSTEELSAALQDTWNAQGEVFIGKFIENGLPQKQDHRPSPRQQFKHVHLWVKVSAEALSMSPQDFFKSLRQGQTPAEIAEAHGSAGQALVDVIVAAEKERLDRAVAEGRITQEKADAILSRISERAAKWVEHGFQRP